MDKLIGIFQQLGVELVIVDQHRETILQPVPNVPDEGTVVEQLAVLREELVT